MSNGDVFKVPADIDEALTRWESKMKECQDTIANIRAGELRLESRQLKIVVKSQMGQLRELMWGLSAGYLE